MVLGAAAVAIVAGCMDPDYVPPAKRGAQNDVKPASGEVANKPVLTPDVKPVADDEPGQPGTGGASATPDITIEKTGCTCLPGTVHDAPCACGAADCKCTVKPAAGCKCAPGTVHDAPCACGAADCKCAVKPGAAAGAAAEGTTTYIVRPGDTLSIISRRFNIKLDSIRKANPQLKGDTIRVGKPLTLPAKVELGEYAAPAAAAAAPAAKKAPAGPYNGPTRDYVVKSGDCVSRLAAANGVTSKQLMDLNGLSNGNIRIGQKLKLPAKDGAAQPAAPAAVAKAVAKSAAKPAAPAPAAPAAVAETVQPPVVEEPAAANIEVPEDNETGAAKAPEAAPAASAQAAGQNGDYISYVVLKGEDITALSISFGIDPSVIRELNNMGDNDQLVPGQTIRLPADAE